MAGPDWLTEWGGELDEFLEDFGEPVTWTHGQGEAETSVDVLAIVRRSSLELGPRPDGSSERQMDEITIRRSDVPGAGMFDRVTIAKRSAQGTYTLATWPDRAAADVEVGIVAAEAPDHGNGMATFGLTAESKRSYHRADIERD